MISWMEFWENEKRKLSAVLLPKVTQAAQNGVQSAARKAGIGLNLELANAAAAEWARRYTDDLLAHLGTTSQRLVGEALSEWIEQPGSTMGDLVALLKPRFEDNRARADLIAVTEVTRAYANGEKSTYLANGITHWRWNTNRDELVCKYCGAINGKVVQIGEAFGWFREKKVTEPPYHPGCRCWVSPAVGKRRESQDRSELAFWEQVAEQVPQAVAQAVGQAVGIPVSQALRIPQKGKIAAPAKNALQAIDSVHGDGNLPDLPVESSAMKRDHGQFWHYDGGGRPTRIRISTWTNHPDLTLCHEIGHFLDYSGMGKPNIFSSETDALLDDWWDAVSKSNAIMRLQTLQSEKEVNLDGMIITIDQDHVRYLLQKKEIFARSYAQYIATKSGNSVLLQQVADYQNKRDKIYAPLSQWLPGDFVPILEAFDRLFTLLGWIV